jgi:predicted dehydrogenase
LKKSIAVLGAGGWGTNWTERVLRDPSVEAVAFADANPVVLESLAARGVPRDRLFSDAQEALDKAPSDAVTVSIPNPDRVPLLMRAVQEGRHVLVDKPLVHTAEALDGLLAAGEGRKTVFMVAQNYRFFAGPRRIKGMIEAGELGKVGAIHGHFLRDSGAWSGRPVGQLPGILGLGMEMCIHHVDMMRFLLDGEPAEMTAHGWSVPGTGLKGFQGVQLHVAFPGGTRVAYDATNAAAYNGTDWNGRWEIIAKRGTLVYGAPGRSLRGYDADGRETISDPGAPEAVDTAQSMDAVWNRFKEGILQVEGGGSPLDTFCPLEDNCRSVRMILAAERSITEGRPITFPAE